MTSPNTGLRRTALVVLAVGAALGASACSAGQISQTANQVAAVDGGHGKTDVLEVNNLVVAVADSGEARVGFGTSFSGIGEPVSLESLEIDGTAVQLGQTEPMDRHCSIMADATEDPETGPAPEDICVDTIAATLPGGEDLAIGTSVPATFSYSNGDTIETQAAVVAPIIEAGEYTRPLEEVGESSGSEGH